MPADVAYRDPAPRSTWAIRLLGVTAGIFAIAIVSDFAEYALIQQAARGEAITLEEATASDTRQAWIAIAQGVAVLVTGIFFIRWFHAAYANLPVLGASGMRYGPGWAIGAWFIPIGNLVICYQIAGDIWRASDPEAPPEQGEDWPRRPVPPLLKWWWGLWILGGVIGIAALPGLDLNTIEGIQRASLATLLTDAAGLAAAILAIRVVRQTTARQGARARVLGVAPGVAGPDATSAGPHPPPG